MTFQHVEAMLKPFQHLLTSGGSMVSVSKSVMAKVRALQAQAKDSIFSTAFEGQTVFRLSNSRLRETQTSGEFCLRGSC
jgi:hypothetical protein